MTAFDTAQRIQSAAPSSRAVLEYYRETIEDYQLWSPTGYMHFGKWEWGLNPFARESMLERMNDYLFELLRVKTEAARIGDFGCGLGAVTRYGARRYPQHRWIGLTISKKQVAWANRGLLEKLPQAEGEQGCRVQEDNWEVCWADYHLTSFEGESLDNIFFLESICHSSELHRILDEAFRVLKTGRRVAIIDGLLKAPEFALPRRVRWLMRETCRNWAVPRFHGLQELVDCARSSGFKILQAEDISWSIVPSVLHSPVLIAWRALVLGFRKLVGSKQPTAWQWRHLRACWLGMFLGLHRRYFGYYAVVLEK